MLKTKVASAVVLGALVSTSAFGMSKKTNTEETKTTTTRETTSNVDSTSNANTSATKVENNDAEKKSASAAQLGRPYKVIEFRKGSAELTDKAANTIKAFIQDAKDKGAEIDKIHVAVWSDRAFPKGDTNLSDKDRELAERRAKNLEKFMEDSLKAEDVQTYSMAEKANWVSKMFNTEGAEIKALFTKDKSAPLDEESFVLFRKNAAPSKAVVLLEWDDEQTENQSSANKKETKKSNTTGL